MTQIITPGFVSKECRFAVYIPPPEHGMPDLHVIKEVLNYPDGTKKTNLLQIRNFKRSFWVTKRGCRDHQQKKEWELLDRVEEGRCTQSQLVDAAAKALGQPGFRGNLRRLSSSPYLYGSDILSTAVIKQTYADKYKVVPSKYSVAVFDTETDMLNGTEDIIIASITFKETVLVVVLEEFVAGIAQVKQRILEKANEHIGEYIKKRNLQIEVMVVPTSFDIVKACINKAHELKPDFLAIWNVNFDIKKVIKACEQAGIDPKTIFSDPSIPKEYQYFEYKEGPNQKVTASGKITPIKPAAQWHTVICPASFYVIDAMCVFKHNRIGEPEKQSYSLDNILNEILGIRKLSFKEDEGLRGAQKHIFMQKNYKLEYIVYNIFDCISMEELDEKTLDMSVSLPLFSGCSDFSKFNSQPRRTVDDLHYYVQTKGRVIGTTGQSNEQEEEFDSETTALTGWITALPAELITDNGLCIIKEYPELRTTVYSDVGDLDVSGAYPTNTCVFNVSKETTKKEVTKIEGVSDAVQRAQGINLSAGHTNAIEFCTGMFNFPNLHELLMDFEHEQKELSVQDNKVLEIA